MAPGSHLRVSCYFQLCLNRDISELLKDMFGSQQNVDAALDGGTRFKTRNRGTGDSENTQRDKHERTKKKKRKNGGNNVLNSDEYKIWRWEILFHCRGKQTEQWVYSWPCMLVDVAS